MKIIISLIIGMALFTSGIREVAAGEEAFDPVIVAIDTAITSLKEQPNQFNLAVRVTGLAVTSSGPGTGMIVEATGGGPGSQTTGLNVSTTGGGQVNIARSIADQALKEQAEEAISLLSEIRSLLMESKVDKPTVMSRLTDFANTYVAPVLKSVIGALVKKKLGP